MGGTRIQHLSLALFKYSWLTGLYLNHNQISSIPHQIKQLKALTVLDLTGNQLMSVPPELGMLSALKELFLFDNMLQTLPFELGSLHQLEMLGMDGNPLNTQLKKILQTEGTPALIAYMRDHAKTPPPPPERQFRSLISDAERRLLDADTGAETFSIMSYNILCQWYATPSMYGYTPSRALQWESRRELILTETTLINADFLCLQEVDADSFHKTFVPEYQKECGYEGVHFQKPRERAAITEEKGRVDGCATFYKSAKWQLLDRQLLDFQAMAIQRPDFIKSQEMFTRVLSKDNIGVLTAFENLTTGARLVIGNLHLQWNEDYKDVKLVQLALALDAMEAMAARVASFPSRPLPGGNSGPVYSEAHRVPTIFCGDLNCAHESSMYDLMSAGSLSPDHEDFMGYKYGVYTQEGMGPKTKFAFKDAYAAMPQLTMTNFTPTYAGILDYIWYSGQTIGLTAALEEVDPEYLSRCVGFPNWHFPSEYVTRGAVSRSLSDPSAQSYPPRRAIPHQAATRAAASAPSRQRTLSPLWTLFSCLLNPSHGSVFYALVIGLAGEPLPASLHLLGSVTFTTLPPRTLPLSCFPARLHSGIQSRVASECKACTAPRCRCSLCTPVSIISVFFQTLN